MTPTFLSPSRCAEGTTTSPLRRALEGADPAVVRDLSLEGIVELRGNVAAVAPGAGEELVTLSSRRAFLFTADDPVDVTGRVRESGVLAYDATGALAGIAIASEQVLRRLTDLDLDSLPTAGPFARVSALFRRGADGWFNVYVQQELGHYVAEAVLDTMAGLDVSRDQVPDLTPSQEQRRGAERDLLPEAHVASAPGVEAPLRGRHRRRRLAWARDGVLPREAAGITDVAILEKSYIGSGASGRNTTIIRSNYRTPEGAAFYGESVRLYQGLSDKLDFNLMFSQHGHLTLAHSDRAMITMQERAEVNKLLGITSSVVELPRMAECARSSTSRSARRIRSSVRSTTRRAGSSGTTRWCGASHARPIGAVSTSITTPRSRASSVSVDRVVAVETNRGRVECGQVVSATAGWSSLVGRLVGVRLPITTHILQAFVTEPVKPFLDVVLVSSQLHVYVSQTDRGEFLIGAEIEPYTTYKGTGTLSFLEYSAAHAIELLPQLERTKVLRTWTGLCDLSPDYSPILGKTEIENFHVSTGWGTYGFKAAPIVGVTLAELVASGRTPDLIAPFALERFHTDTLVSELAAAAVSH